MASPASSLPASPAPAPAGPNESASEPFNELYDGLLTGDEFLERPLPITPAARWVPTAVASTSALARPQSPMLRPGSSRRGPAPRDLAPPALSSSVDLTYRDVLLAVHGSAPPLPSMQDSSLLRQYSMQDLLTSTGSSHDMPIARRRPISAAGPREVASRRELHGRSDIGSRFPLQFHAYLQGPPSAASLVLPPPEPIDEGPNWTLTPSGRSSRTQVRIRELIAWSQVPRGQLGCCAAEARGQMQRGEVKRRTSSAQHLKGFSPAKAFAQITRGIPPPAPAPAERPHTAAAKAAAGAPVRRPGMGRPGSAAPSVGG